VFRFAQELGMRDTRKSSLIPIVLFDRQNRTVGPCLPTLRTILMPIMDCGAPSTLKKGWWALMPQVSLFPSI
jgi:hypothetical protein